MVEFPERLRVAFLAGTLGQGGAEKQLLYMARALLQAGVDVQLYCLTQGEFYENAFQAIGLSPIGVGRFASPLLRLATLARRLWQFRPHFIQSAHAYTNLYVALIGRLVGAIDIGTMRSNLKYITSDETGGWTRWIIRMPTALLVNSQKARQEVTQNKLAAKERTFVLPNVIDLSDYRERNSSACSTNAIFIGRLVAVKRLDRFFRALLLARQQCPTLKGIIIGDGPERAAWEKQAAQVGLCREHLLFFGQSANVPALLQQAAMLILCSDDEGFPNVLLEAMAAGVPVITTPAGDSDLVVQNGVTGYVVPFDDAQSMADRMVSVAKSADLRRRLGEAGRRRVEHLYNCEGLADRLFAIYRQIAQRQHDYRLLQILSNCRQDVCATSNAQLSHQLGRIEFAAAPPLLGR